MKQEIHAVVAIAILVLGLTAWFTATRIDKIEKRLTAIEQKSAATPEP